MLKRIKKNIGFILATLALLLVLTCILLNINYDFVRKEYSKYHISFNSNKKVEKTKMYEVIKEAKEKEKTIHWYGEIDATNLNKTVQEEKINIYKTNKWRIKIPTIGLDAPITEGTTQEDLRRTVGHFEQTSKWEGNVALAGHNRGYRCNFFQEIKNLKMGDIIIYSTEKGEKRYKVIMNKIIKETDWTYLKETRDNRITLITCEINKREYRRCIQAIEIKDN